MDAQPLHPLQRSERRDPGLADPELHAGALGDQTPQVQLDRVEGRIESPGVVGDQFIRSIGDHVEGRQGICRAAHPGHGRID